MKQYLVITCLTLVSASVMAMQTPAQQSANTITAIVQSILNDSGLELLNIKKISANHSDAKAELVNQKGECMAIPYVVKADALGTISVEINKAALAECDE